MLTNPVIGLDGGGGAVGVPPPVLLGDDGELHPNVNPTQRTLTTATADIFIDPTLIHDSTDPNLFRIAMKRKPVHPGRFRAMPQWYTNPN